MRFTALLISEIEEEVNMPLFKVLQQQTYKNLALFYQKGNDITIEQAFVKINRELEEVTVDRLWEKVIDVLADSHFLSLPLIEAMQQERSQTEQRLEIQKIRTQIVEEGMKQEMKEAKEKLSILKKSGKKTKS